MTDEKWPELLTVAEVAPILRVSKMTVYRLVKDGALESCRVGRSFRVKEASLRQYISGNARVTVKTGTTVKAAVPGDGFPLF